MSKNTTNGDVGSSGAYFIAVNPNSVVVTDAADNITTVNPGAAGTVLTSTGTTTLPNWQAVGTSSANILGGAAGKVVYQSAPSTTSFSAVGTTGQVLLSGGTGAPTWTGSPTFTAPNVGDASATSLQISSTSYTPLKVLQTNANAGTQLQCTNSSIGTPGTAIFGISDATFQQGAAYIAATNDVFLVPNGNGGGGTIALRAKSNGQINIPNLTASQIVSTDSNKNLTTTATNGSGNVVLTTSPTLVTPNLGAATASSLSVSSLSSGSTNIGTASGTSLTVTSLTANQAVFTDGSKNLVSSTAYSTGRLPQTNSFLSGSFSWSAPAGCRYFKVEAIGGGGGGTAGSANPSAISSGGGGGSGGYIRFFVAADPTYNSSYSTSISGSVGAAGRGEKTPGGMTDGGSTTITIPYNTGVGYVTCNGGGHAILRASGAGGTVTTANVSNIDALTYGGGGSGGIYWFYPASGNDVSSGCGAPTPFGAGGGSVYSTYGSSGANGTTGGGWGSGGSGGAGEFVILGPNGTGGDGNNGIVYLTAYF
jgi:hypothetical protein